MKKYLFFFVIIISLCSYALMPSKKVRTGINLSGIWEQIMGPFTSNEKDKNSQEVYKIQHKGNNIYMVCLKKKRYYTFSHIHLTDNNFTFQLTNRENPGDPLVLAYNLYLNEAGNLLEGTAVNNKSVEVKVELKKIR